jgi:hypothetical protein
MKIAAFLWFFFAQFVLFAQVPPILNYQGRVQAGGADFSGTGQFKFALVNADGAQTLWSNDNSSVNGAQPVASVAIQVNKGLFSVRLGDTALPNMLPIPSTAFAGPSVFLRVWFNDGAKGFQQLAPDQRIVAVGYAMNAELLAGSPQSAFARAAQAEQLQTQIVDLQTTQSAALATTETRLNKAISEGDVALQNQLNIATASSTAKDQQLQFDIDALKQANAALLASLSSVEQRLNDLRQIHFNIEDYGAVVETDCIAALTNAINAAMAAGDANRRGVVVIPKRYKLSQLFLSNLANVEITGPGSLEPAGPMDLMLKLGGTNLALKNLTMDGAYLTRNLLELGYYSTDIVIENVKWKRGQLNQANNSLGEAANSLDLLRFTRGNRRIRVTNCDFTDSTSVIGQAVRGVRAIRAAGLLTGTTNENWDDITIDNCSFDGIGPDQTEADPIVLQECVPNENGEMLANYLISNCRVRNSGRRAFKIAVGGGTIVGNRIKSHRPGPSPDAMYAAISVMGSEVSVVGNTIDGGAFFRGIEVTHTPTTGRPRAVTVIGNSITINGSNTNVADGIALVSAYECTVTGNTIKNARFGVRLIGKTEFCGVGVNTMSGIGSIGVTLSKETDATSLYFGVAPADCAIIAPIVNSAAAYGVRAQTGCLRIQTLGFTGSAAFGNVEYDAGVTGERIANWGSKPPTFGLKQSLDPGAPAAGNATLWVDTEGGKLVLKTKFPSGVSQTIATEP